MNIALHAIIGGTISGISAWGFFKFMNFDFRKWEFKRITDSDREFDDDNVKLAILAGTIIGAFISISKSTLKMLINAAEAVEAAEAITVLN
uniref:DUF4235 domain-containing protein n=1 Tax=viral metagenome TaxID=1070528 RepID=A0A6C0LRF2_9ZZZZ